MREQTREHLKSGSDEGTVCCSRHKETELGEGMGDSSNRLSVPQGLQFPCSCSFHAVQKYYTKSTISWVYSMSIFSSSGHIQNNQGRAKTYHATLAFYSRHYNHVMKIVLQWTMCALNGKCASHSRRKTGSAMSSHVLWHVSHQFEISCPPNMQAWW